MEVEDYRRLWDFSYRARDKLLTAATGMTEAEFTAPTGLVYPTLRALFAHTANSESMWLSRWQGLEVLRIREEEVPNLQILIERWSGVEERMRAFFDSIDQSVIDRPFTVRIRDVEETRPLRDLLTMTLFHTAQHRAEAAEALSKLGRSPGELDYIFYVRERGL